jgi:hypothetical protein
MSYNYQIGIRGEEKWNAWKAVKATDLMPPIVRGGNKLSRTAIFSNNWSLCGRQSS